MNYDNFENALKKENRSLKVILGIVLLITSVSTVMTLMQRKYFLYKGGEVFQERPLAEEICKEGFISLASKKPNPYLVHKEIIKLAKENEFGLPIDEILMVQSLERNACKIIFKSQGALTSFKIVLHESKDYPFYYQILQLDEVGLDKEVL